MTLTQAFHTLLPDRGATSTRGESRLATSRRSGVFKSEVVPEHGPARIEVAVSVAANVFYRAVCPSVCYIVANGTERGGIEDGSL